MLYDLSQAKHREQVRKRFDAILKNDTGILELKLLKPKRTIKQNNYLHLIIGYFACAYGESEEYVKEHYFKMAANKQLFLVSKRDKVLNEEVTYLRSSRDLTTDEMQLAIERFRNWSSINAGIYLPSADEHRLLELAEIEIERNKEFV